MDSRDPKIRRWPTIALAIVVLVALMVCVLLGGMLYLPDLASRHLPVEPIRRLGFADFSGRITRIGLHQAAAGPFLFGRIDKPVVSIGSVVADYTPGGLRRKTIDRLRIDDMTVHVLLGPDGIVLPGLDGGRPDEKAPAGPSVTGPLPAELDGAIGKIEIRSARVILNWQDATYRIPFEADIRPEGTGPAKLTARLRLLPGDQPITLNARLDMEKNGGDLTLEGDAIHLDRFAHLFHLVPGLDLTGILSLAARARLGIAPLALADVEIKAVWHGGRMAFGSLAIAPESPKGEVHVSALSADVARWQARVEGLHFQTPAPVAVNSVVAAIDLAAEAPSITGTAGLVLRPFSVQCPRPLSLENDLELSLAWDIRKHAANGWSAACHTVRTDESGSSGGAHLASGDLRLQSGIPQLRLDASIDGQELQAQWRVDLQAVGLEGAGLNAKLPRVRGEGQIKTPALNGPAWWRGDVRIRLPEAMLAGHGLSGSLNDLRLSAEWERRTGPAPSTRGRLQISNGRLTHAASGLDLSGLRLDLPYDLAAKVGPGLGSLTARIGLGRRQLGQLQGRITQKEGAFHLAASHSFTPFPGMTADLTGSLQPTINGLPEVFLSLDLPAYDLPTGDDLGRLSPALDGVALTGIVSARATASVSGHGLYGSGDLSLGNGRLEIARKKLTVEGIETTVHFPELPRVRSGPAQSVRFARAALGGIAVDGGRFDFQVESPTTLFVEKGRLAWCGGKVDAQSLRVTAGKQAYALGLYCQRLELSRILEQLGAVNAKGSGTVNGRIPIVYSNNRIRFDDGFLFSTPGEPGQIQLTGTEILTRGIPAGTPQFAQVELAREALKDYAYKWAKLGMTSEDETLVLRLQFDGQPVGPLPFVYRKEIGSFVRVEAGAQRSLFQGIALDVNLKLPLDRLLEYKEIVDMIQ